MRDNYSKSLFIIVKVKELIVKIKELIVKDKNVIMIYILQYRKVYKGGDIEINKKKEGFKDYPAVKNNLEGVFRGGFAQVIKKPPYNKMANQFNKELERELKKYPPPEEQIAFIDGTRFVIDRNIKEIKKELRGIK